MWLEEAAFALDYSSDPGEVYYSEPAYYAEVGEFAELDMWGTWQWVEPMGWVWSPSVGPYWRPFTSGHWYYSNYGWAWYSYEPWGWATAHYGWWAFDGRLGWIWIPGWDWAPARVDWMIYGDYVCWAPLPWHQGWPDPWMAGGGSYWIVVGYDNFDKVDVGSYHHMVDFKTRYKTVRGQAPDVRVFERRYRHALQPITLDFKSTRRGDKTVQRVVNPRTRDQRVVTRPVREAGTRTEVKKQPRQSGPTYQQRETRTVEFKQSESGQRSSKVKSNSSSSKSSTQRTSKVKSNSSSSTSNSSSSRSSKSKDSSGKSSSSRGAKQKK